MLELYARIARDARHVNSKVFYQGPVTSRSFAQWSMAFKRLDDADSADLRPFADFLHAGFDETTLNAPPNTGKDLLLMLRRTMLV